MQSFTEIKTNNNITKKTKRDYKSVWSESLFYSWKMYNLLTAINYHRTMIIHDNGLR